jgi:hypothetical protein
MKIHEQVDQIVSRQDLIAFIEALRSDLLDRSDDWENPTLEGFLGALAAWTTDMDGYFLNRGEQVPSQPSWRLIGDMLYAAKIYE